MAIFEALDRLVTTSLAIPFFSLLAIGFIFSYLFQKPSFPSNAPPLTKESWPIIGSPAFFSERWSFYQRAHKASKSGHFSFYAGQNPVIGLSAVEESSRRLFFDSKALSAAEAYSVLLAGVPTVKRNIVVNPKSEDLNLTDKDAKLRYRMITMMKSEKLSGCIPWMIKDVRNALDELKKDPKAFTDPFQSIYRIVFQLTVRLSACDELADDPVLREQTLHYFEQIAGATSPLTIMFPWIPSWGKVMRTYGGVRLFMIFKKLTDQRKVGDKFNDTLQMLVNLKDTPVAVIEFVISSLFAGQNNTGIQGAWILTQLAHNIEWQRRVREEVVAVANEYCHDTELPLAERLSKVPFDAWDKEFPMIYLCLRETMRLGMPGTAFRKNISDQNILIPGTEEVIPPNTYVAMHVFDAHLNADVYDEPIKWDPSRYLPDRAEDKRQIYSWMGWGHGRHPCLGIRFARLEINMIIAFWFAYFEEFEHLDAAGNKASEAPAFNNDDVGTHLPQSKVYLKYNPS
ncbi:uncharacterized protein MYCFIDRAFT_211364 [Pseudocercospora fijiensis CIRAD86]|uniref:Cytochrome P450 n=1 Tax=Pseudocercospora fijiensis (strain CIRAD86) TaxID=383855 RepID=M2ZX04_PSEFD|nr:uncharacterized protein MYCFIDRAFT_211364 [Pseudocercospora fijiensis CIRAD86]EME83524.1 hypothetical protein MYCFIDRAFT_211364 [Pseudocercospora fijiensis CIRAD86]